MNTGVVPAQYWPQHSARATPHRTAFTFTSNHTAGSLDLVQRCDAEQGEALAHDDCGGLAQQQAAGLFWRPNHLAVHVEAIELLAEVVQVVAQPAWVAGCWFGGKVFQGPQKSC